MEQPLTNLDSKTGDCVFVYGENSPGDRLLAKIIRTKHHNEFWLRLRLSDGRSYEPAFPEKVYPPSSEFTAGGLRIKCRTPFRRFRVSFNGLLREIKVAEKTETETLVHVKFSFTCVTSCFPFDLRNDIHPYVLSEYFAKENILFIPSAIKSADEMLDSIIQTANVYGTVSVDGAEETEVSLWGVRKRSKEVFPKHKRMTISEFIGYTKDGQLIYSGECQFPSSKYKLSFGFYLQRTTLSWPVTHSKITFNSQKSSTEGMKIQLITGYGSACACVEAPDSTTNYRGVESESKVSFAKFSLQDGDQGFGVFIDSLREYGQNEDFIKPRWQIELNGEVQQGPRKLVVPLRGLSCQDTTLSGGKGSSLAVLTSLAVKYRTGFKVPQGFVVSTAAYEEFCDQCGVRPAVASVENNAWTYTGDTLKEKCAQLVEKVSRVELPANIKMAVEQQILAQFPDKSPERRFAVRSSASGEDSEEMSAAGQMSTLLGVKGLENIFDAIVKCWASQFSFTAIQYKRQNGQEFNSPMAVVVQEMVAADTAGVLFTCDPVTGNPQNITITANYGLGESVVSASADPDTLVFQRNYGNQISLKSSTIGRKSTKTVMGDQDSIVELNVEEDESATCCLNEENGSLLAEIGLKIEEAYGLPVDIEWAFKNSQLYLLQARPITTFDLETKYELFHACTAALRAEDEYNSKANIGEVMPGATSHLGMTFMIYYLYTSCDLKFGARDKYVMPYNPFFPRFNSFWNQGFLNVPSFLLRTYKKGESSFLAEGNQVGVLGRVLDDQAPLDQADRRNRMYPSPFGPLQLAYLIQDIIFGDRGIDQSMKKFWNKEVDFTSCHNSKEMFVRIWNTAMELTDPAGAHFTSSMISSIFNNLVLGILATANKGWDQKVYSDFALILSSCGNLVSADIPRSMKAFAAAIRNSKDIEEFKNMSAEEALAWLENTMSPAGRAYRDIIMKHGHRCLGEFDVYTKPWRVDRLPLIKAIQSYVNQTEESDKPFISTNEVLKKMEVSLSWKSKQLLKLLIPMCRRGVCSREKSKSLLIKIVDNLRKGFCALGEQLVKEGRLPDKELVFFLTSHEVEELTCSRSPGIVQRAIRRKNIFPELDKLSFPEFTAGLPKPLQREGRSDNEEDFVSDLEMKGTPVSQGTIKGFARVATTIEEAANIKSGEILIAYSTDIAWSPYFPLLTGVATELGGLISHGAVVAREYGLPCVVGVSGATRKFRTGDYILLDGNKGVLKRLEHMQEG